MQITNRSCEGIDASGIYERFSAFGVLNVFLISHRS